MPETTNLQEALARTVKDIAALTQPGESIFRRVLETNIVGPEGNDSLFDEEVRSTGLYGAIRTFYDGLRADLNPDFYLRKLEALQPQG